MSEAAIPVGAISWADITVPDASALRDFYAAVAGWRPEPVDMDGYSDFAMISPDTGMGVAGVCHARGKNAAVPPQWLIYITVSDLRASVETALSLGATVVTGDPDAPPEGGYCILRDPASAVFALYQAPAA